MKGIEDLPDEILLLIIKRLDYFSLLNLSQSSKRFERFFNDSEIIKKVDVLSCYSVNNSWKIFKTFLNKSKSVLTHLNLSYNHWVHKSEFLHVLKNLTCLQYLNVFGTSIWLCELEKNINEMEMLKTVCVTHCKGKFLTIKPIHIKHLHIQVEMIDLSNFIQAAKTPKRLKHVHVKVEIQNGVNFKSVFQSYYIVQLLTDLSFASLLIEKIPWVYDISTPYLCKYSCYYKHIMLETSSRIYLSKDLCPDIEENSLIKRYSENDVDRLPYVEYAYFMSIYNVSEGCDDFNHVEKYVRERINDRTNNLGIMFSMKCSVFGTDEIIQRALDSTTFKQLVFTPKQLMTEVEENKHEEPLFKKAKRSYIPEVPKHRLNIFQQILAKNRGVLSLNVQQDKYLTPNIVHSEKSVVYNWNSLFDITSLAFLKHLSLTVFPNDCKKFAKQLFLNCTQLQSLQAGSPRYQKIEAIAECAHLSNSLRIIYLRSSMRQIDDTLNHLSKVTNLHTIALTDDRDETKQPHRASLPALLNLIDKCKKLVFLFLYQEGMKQSLLSEYRRCEKVCKSKSDKLFASFTCNFFFDPHEKDHFNIYFPASKETSLEQSAYEMCNHERFEIPKFHFGTLL